MTKTVLSFILLLTLGVIVTPRAFSQTPTPTTCPALYNGGAVCQVAKDFSVDKKIQTPGDGSFVDQIPQSDRLIAPERTMIFRIEVTNKTSRTLRNIAVTDTLPAHIQFVRSDVPVKQSGDKLTLTITSLETKKTSRVNIETKVKAKSSLPATSPITCVANQVEARSGFNNLGRDFVTFCIDNASTNDVPPTTTTSSSFPDRTKGGKVAATIPTPTPTPLTSTKGGQVVHPAPNATNNPNTGPEALALIALLPAGAAGIWFRKKTGNLRQDKSTQ